MRTNLLQLERLRRNYEVSVRTYDEISLYELAHSLRIWTDLARSLPAKFGTTVSFKSATPAKKVLKAIRGHRYVCAYMADGVRTYTRLSEVAFAPGELRKDVGMTMTCMLSRESDNSSTLKNFFFVETCLPDQLRNATKEANVSRGNFMQWLGSECVRVSFQNDQGRIIQENIKREALIRRVANTLGGSHPIGADRQYRDSDLNAAVKHLLEYRVLGVPLPYFVLLKAAQDILSIAPGLLKE